MTDTVNRRAFMGTTGSVLGIGLTGSPPAASEGKSGFASSIPCMAGGLGERVQALVTQTPLMDTHEHLPPEGERLANAKNPDASPAADFGMLLSHYTDSDLRVAGLSAGDYKKLISSGLEPREKWKLVAPYYERCRHTGYQRCVRESVRALYGEEDIREETCESISQQLLAGIQPGFYRHILREVANIEHAQINCLRSTVFQDKEPASDLLSYDLWTLGIASGVNMNALNHCAGGPVSSLKEAHAAIDLAFEKYGPKAIAVKDQCAYSRRLYFAEVSDAEAAPLFARFAKDKHSLTGEERTALQDHLFRRCLRRATELGLPVKLHTGYYAGYGATNLAQMRDNMTDLARLFQDFPETTFVLMHIGYPYQHELTVLCKRYPRVYADMCWAWIIDPASATRFLREFLMAAPASKILTFGGDFIPVELVPGHARMARHGIALAITQLAGEGWLEESDVPALVERIMRGNAHEIFDLARVLKA